jgi:predicted small secreted protein
MTWRAVGDPIVGQGGTTGQATFNNIQGPIVADPHTGNVYDIYAAGEHSVQKGTSADYNNIIVSRSTDRGRTWTARLVFHAPTGTALDNIFPALAVDPSDGTLWASWSDQHRIWVSSSTDQGGTWTAPIAVSSAATVVMPWVAARNGKVDVVYYGTSAASVDDPNADWFVYDSQLSGSWAIKKVSNTSNRHGAVCLGGAGCTADRQLLDLFEVVEDPVTGKAAVVYTDSTIDTYTDASGVHQLPEIVLAYEN